MVTVRNPELQAWGAEKTRWGWQSPPIPTYLLCHEVHGWICNNVALNVSGDSHWWWEQKCYHCNFNLFILTQTSSAMFNFCWREDGKSNEHQGFLLFESEGWTGTLYLPLPRQHPPIHLLGSRWFSMSVYACVHVCVHTCMYTYICLCVPVHQCTCVPICVIYNVTGHVAAGIHLSLLPVNAHNTCRFKTHICNPHQHRFLLPLNPLNRDCFIFVLCVVPYYFFNL